MQSINNNLEKLEKEIDYHFKNIKLLDKALTHTSYAYEKKVESNEKLEFLGDSILEFVSIAKKHNFGDFLNLGKSEKVSQSEVRPAIMADSVEAVIAAIFLDGGIEPAKKFILSNLIESIENSTKHIGQKDYKTVLQEILQKNGNAKIEYEIIKESGPDHDKIFFAEVKCNGKILAGGDGKSKKLAEMQAAKKALERAKKL